MGRLTWLPEALDDIERLYAFLAEKNPTAARASASAILEGAETIRSSPRIGRLMLLDALRRELFVKFGSGGYVLRYIIDADGTPVIIRVWHSKENKL